MPDSLCLVMLFQNEKADFAVNAVDFASACRFTGFLMASAISTA
jgi:hypothetical protein